MTHSNLVSLRQVQDMDIVDSVVDPDPHGFGRVDPDPDPAMEKDDSLQSRLPATGTYRI